jgi:hypothetical protein
MFERLCFWSVSCFLHIFDTSSCAQLLFSESNVIEVFGLGILNVYFRGPNRDTF